MANQTTTTSAVVTPAANSLTGLQQLGMQLADTDIQSQTLTTAAKTAVTQFQSQAGLQATGVLDDATAAAIDRAVADATYEVSGVVASPDSAAVNGLSIAIIDQNVGGDVTLAKAGTDINGNYSASIVISPRYLDSHSKKTPDLFAAASQNNTVLGSSAVQYGASSPVSLDVLLPAGIISLPSEYETLTAAIATCFSGSLATLQEGEGRQDVTFLANKTGWDARAVAMAVLAGQFSQASTITPAPPAQQVAPSQAGTSSTAAPPSVTATPAGASSPPAAQPKAASAPADPPAPAAAPQAAPATTPPAPAKNAAASTPDGSTAPTSTSTGSSPASSAPAVIQPEFFYALFRAGIPANHDGIYSVSSQTVNQIWTDSISSKIVPSSLAGSQAAALTQFQALRSNYLLGASAVQGLSTLSGLLSITLPNAADQQKFAQIYEQNQNDMTAFWKAVGAQFDAATVSKLQLDGQLALLTLNNAGLIQGLYKALGSTTITSPLQLIKQGYYDPSKWTALIGQSVPSGIPGSTPAEQASNYANLIVAQLQISFPTAVFAEKFNALNPPLVADAGVKTEVYGFLSNPPASFELGLNPLGPYLAANKTTLSADAVAQLKGLQRIYQITPTDEASYALLSSCLDSAYKVVNTDRASFRRTYGQSLGGDDVADAVYYKAQTVVSTGLQITAGFLTHMKNPSFGGPIFGQAFNNPPANPTVSATLQNLFGSMDYCECDDCRSILSPAAYLVDLLNYLNCPSPPAGSANPQAVLFTRRPDIQYLPLTCDNTNTVIPYIDIVNETLEYFVTNKGSLQNYQGHNTDDSVTSEELLASPEFVSDAAYGTLETAWFPPPLPFHRPLEMLRRYFNQFTVPLQDAMALLRQNDSLERGASPYGWRDVLMEQLLLSREEYRILTDSTLTLNQLYGYPAAQSQATVLKSLSSFQSFATTALHDDQTSYTDLISILETRFINPGAALLGQVTALNVSFSSISQLQAGTLTQTAFNALVPTSLDLSPYGFSPAQWVLSNYEAIMDLIVLVDPTDTNDLCTVSNLVFQYANPNSTSNSLQPVDYYRLIRFIRLWEKLDEVASSASEQISIQQTDSILAALLPPNFSSSLANLDSAFLAMLPALGWVFRVIELLNLDISDDLASLLALWAPIDTFSSASLYANMFLGPAMVQQDPAFIANSSGLYLQDPAQKILSADTSASVLIGGSPKQGDVLTFKVNGFSVPYTVQAGDATLAGVAVNVAAAINTQINQASPPADPLTSLPLNQVLLATSYMNTVTLNTINSGVAAFLSWAVSAGATETLTAANSLQQIVVGLQSGTSPKAGDILTTVIDGVSTAYTVAATDTTTSVLAASLAACINSQTTNDPVYGLAVNSLVQAYASGSVVVIKANGTAVSFTVGASVSSGAVESYQIAPQVATASIGGQAITQGDTLTTQINSVSLAYTVAAADTPQTIASNIAAQIKATTTVDSVSGLQLGQLVAASSSSDVVTIQSTSPANGFALQCSVAAGATETYFASSDHEPALRSAFNLSGSDLLLIATSLDFDSTTPLTLENISAIYRRGWLAQTLEISVLEFLLLVQYTGLDPFAPWTPSSNPTIPPLIQFINLLQDMNAAGLQPQQALYLFWNNDITGTSAPSSQDLLALAQTLRNDFAAIQAQFAVADDPTGAVAQSLLTLVYGTSAAALYFSFLNGTFTSTAAYQSCGDAAVDAAVQNAAVGASNGTLAFNALTKQFTYTGGALQSSLIATIEGAAAGQAATAYQAEVAAAQAASQPVPTDDTGQAKANLASLLSQLQSPSQTFFTQYPDLLAPYNAYVNSSAATATKRTALLSALLPSLISQLMQQQALSDATAAAGADPTFAAALLTNANVMGSAEESSLPAVQDLTAINNLGLSANFYFSNSVATAASESLAFTNQIAFAPGQTGSSQTLQIGGTQTAGDTLTANINNVAVTYKVLATDTTSAKVATGLVAAINGTATVDSTSSLPLNQLVSASNSDSAGNPLSLITISEQGNNAFTVKCALSAGATETFMAQGQLPAVPGGQPMAAVFSGYLNAPQNGSYNLVLTADSGAQADIVLGGSDVQMEYSAATKTWSNGQPITLTAGTLTPIAVTVSNFSTTLSLSWQSTGLAQAPIPGSYLYSQSLVDNLSVAYVRFLKAVSLAGDLDYDASEAAFLANALTIGGRGFLGSLTSFGNPSQAVCAELTGVLKSVQSFAIMKANLCPNDERLLNVLQNPSLALPNGADALLTLTRWDQTSLNALLLQFFNSTGRGMLGTIDNLRRVYDAFGAVTTCRISAPALIAAATNEPTAGIVRNLQAAMRALYAEADWLQVIQPINDAMRSLQRDALVAYVLQSLGSNAATSSINTPDKLFEYFLMDVEMEPCQQTSRVRLALSSVQLFIERCLRSLELNSANAALNVDPACFTYSPPGTTIPSKADNWEWMKRYRVWEANREVFLWPENWLDPTLRTDATPIFQSVMQNLLQSDITNNAAKSAYLTYLSNLEEIAKLEISGMCYDDTNPAYGPITHVIARTTGANRKYYYRYLSNTWSAWEEITLKIEDDPVLPVIWNNRLLLFWLQIHTETQVDPTTAPAASGKNTFAGDKTALTDKSLSLSKISSDAHNTAKQQNVVNITAVLHWSEYYNGQWQPVKTSDPNAPTLITTTSPRGFDRTAWKLMAFPDVVGQGGDAVADGQLWLLIQPAVPGNSLEYSPSGFLFYNTHSKPVRLDDKPASPPSNSVLFPDISRFLEVGSGGFVSGVWFAEFFGGSGKASPQGYPIQPLLGTSLSSSSVEPDQPIDNAPTAPFFFENSRHVFYVTVDPIQTSLASYFGFGLPSMPPPNYTSTTPIVFQPPPGINLDNSSDNLGVSPITRTILSNDTIQLDNITIGPAGAINAAGE